MLPRTKDKSRKLNYSEAFKMKLVDEIEKGYLTQAEASRLYDVGDSNVSRWVIKYGMNNQIGKRVIIMTDRELRESELLKRENKRLQRALDDTQFSNLILEKYIQFIAEEEGLDLKKSINSSFSEKSKKILISRLIKNQE